MRSSLRGRLVAMVGFVVCCVLGTSVHAGSASIGAAVSLKEAVTEMAGEFERETGDTITFAFGSSGQILAQIRSGAVLDGFISAAKEQIDAVIADGLADAESRRVVVTNSLVLVVPPTSTLGLRKLEDLKRPEVRRIAVGEPKTVPSGLYSSEVFASLKLSDQLKDRLVYGSNARQVLDYVQRGEVDAGIVYLTDAKQAGDAVKVVATADPSLHEPIVYPAVILKKGTNQDVAARFLEYLRSDKARAVFREHGFGLPESPTTAMQARR